MKFLRGLLLLVCMVCSIGKIAAQDDPNCLGAPLPRLVIGQQGRVMPGDANNVRPSPGTSEPRSGRIPAGETFKVLEGPVCTEGFNWWKVDYEGMIGWTVEGEVTEYWIEPFTPLMTATPGPTPTPMPTGTPIPTVIFTPPLPVINQIEIGTQVRIIDDDPAAFRDRPLLRPEPTTSSQPLMPLELGVLLTVVDGPQEADGYRWWQVETAMKTQGWVVESVGEERALLAVCPDTENRIAYVVSGYLYTSDADGSNRCIYDRMVSSYTREPIWSPDRQSLLFVWGDLYQISIDGRQRERRIDNAGISVVDWSPDGQRLLTVEERDQTSQVWTQRADKSAVALLTTNEENKVWAAWLDDSETVLYVERGSGGYVFFTVNVMTGGLKEIFRTGQGISMRRISLSPDRKYVAFMGEVVSNSTSTPHTLILDARTGKLLFDFPVTIAGHWSPESTHLMQVNPDSILTLPLIQGGQLARVNLSTPLPVESIDGFPVEWVAADTVRVIINGAIYHINPMTGQVTNLSVT